MLSKLTCDGLDSRGMAFRAPWGWVVAVDFGEVFDERAQREQTAHYTLI